MKYQLVNLAFILIAGMAIATPQAQDEGKSPVSCESH